MELRIGTDKRFTIEEGEEIYGTLKRNDVYLTGPCGGKGVCGKCRVKVIEGKHRVISYGKLEQKERKEGMVLACLTIPESDLLIEIPKESKLVVGDKIEIKKTNSF